MLKADAFDPHIIMHAAALISVAALALRDQLKLRSVLVVSILLSALYNYLKVPTGYQEIGWNAVTFAINLVVLVQIILDRTKIGMNDEESDLFTAFDILTPGEFRDFVKFAHWHTAGVAEVVTTEGETPDKLYYILRGGADIAKTGRYFQVGSNTFIGEVAFLHGTVASATVTLQPGSRYIEWPVHRLQKQIDRRQSLKHAVLRLISFDVAMKVARA